MAEQFWIRRDPQVVGPFSARQLRNAAVAGKLRPEDEISRDREKWILAAKVKGLEFQESGAPPHDTNGEDVSPRADEPRTETAQTESATTGKDDSTIQASEPSEVSVPMVCCNNCNKHLRLTPPEDFVSISPEGAPQPVCPTCHNRFPIVQIELGCPFCHKGLNTSDILLGHAVACPNCRAPLTLPTEDELLQLEVQADKYKWTVFAEASADPLRFDGLEDLCDAIKNSRVSGAHTCVTHEFAAPKSLRDTCDGHFALQRLYDPLGAHCLRAARIMGAFFVVLIVLSSARLAIRWYSGAIRSDDFLRSLLFSAFWYGLGFLIAVSICWLVGYGFGYGLAWIAGKAIGLEKRIEADPNLWVASDKA